MANRVSIIVAIKDRFSRGLKRVQTRFQKFVGNISALSVGITGIIGAALVDFGVKAGKAARDAEAAERKFKTVFKGVQDDVDEWARQYSDDFGIAESATKRLAGTLGDFLVPVGATREQAFSMTRAVSQVAGAIALFDNTAPEKVFEDILSAFAGSSEVLLKYGTVVTETALKQEALRLGFEEITGQIDPYTRSLLITNVLLESQEDALSQLTVTQRNQQAEINRSIAFIKKEQEELGKGVALLQSWGAQLVSFFFTARNKVQGFISDLGNRVGEMIAAVNPAFGELRKELGKVTDEIDSTAEGTEGLSDLAKEQAEETEKLKQEISKLIKQRVSEVNAIIRTSNAEKNAIKVKKESERALEEQERVLERSTDLWEDYADAQDSATKSTQSFAKQRRELEEQERAAQQSIPERLARELQQISDERATLLENASISRQQRKRELDDLRQREEYVNNIIKDRGITQQQIAEATRRENRPQIAKDIETIEKRISDIRTRQQELDERADEAKINNLKKQLEIVQKIYEVTKKTAGARGGGGGLSRTSPGREAFRGGGLAPSFGNLGLRSVRAERTFSS